MKVRNLLIPTLTAGMALAGCGFSLPWEPTLPAPSLEPLATSVPIPLSLVQEALQSNPVNSQKIIFVGQSQQGLYSMNPDGSGLQFLVSFDPAQLVDAQFYNIQHPILSPDGQVILFELFISQSNGYYRDLYLINMDGSGLRQLTQSLTGDVPGDGSWAPDSRYVVFSVGDLPTTQLMILDTYSGVMWPLVDFYGWNLRQKWSPDGQNIAFIHHSDPLSVGSEVYAVYLVHPDGSDLREVAIIEPLPSGPIGELAWSPDGRRIAYSGTSNDQAKVQVISFDENSNVIDTQSSACEAYDLKWSADGTTLGAHCLAGDKENVYIWNMMEPMNLAISLGEGRNISFSPDGKYLLYVNPFDISEPYRIKLIISENLSSRTEEIALPDEQVMIGEFITWSPSTFDGRGAALPTTPPATQATDTTIYCNNSYWPVVQGAWWKYYYPGHIDSSDSQTWVDSIDSISPGGELTFFTVKSLNEGTNAPSYRTYSCDTAGGFFDELGNEILPPEVFLSEGYQWTRSDGITMSVTFFHFLESRTALGIQDVMQIIYVGQMQWDFYARGIGPYGKGDGASGTDLIDYYLPVEVPVSDPPQPSINECHHPFWPVKEGNEWLYGSIGTIPLQFKWVVLNLGVDEQGRSYFTIRQIALLSDHPDEDFTYYCQSGGIYDEIGRVILPPVEAMTEVQLYGDSIENMTKLVTMDQVAYKNTFVEVVLMQIPRDAVDTEWVWVFGRGIGLVRKFNYTTALGTIDLYDDNFLP
jgi:hypothetical protein